MSAGKTPVYGPGGGGGAGTQGFNGGAGSAGQVELIYTPGGAPTYNIVRFLLSIPSGGDTNNAIVAQYKTSGKVATVILTYTTASSGSLVMTGKDSGGTLLFTSAALTGVNNVSALYSMELIPGGTIGYRLSQLRFDNTATQNVGTASASGSIGTISEVDVSPNSDLAGSSLGHVIVQYTFESLSSIFGAASGYAGELAGTRFNRLCGELGIDSVFVGNTSDTPAMGPQPDDKPMNVLQQIEDLDRGLMFEPMDQFGLGYRTYTDMTNQDVYTNGLIADYSAGQLSQPFQPTSDDQLTRNDITVSRTNGSSVRVMQATGPLSTLDPPNGVGDYTYSITVNANTDSQLAAVASKILTAGTVDDYRYPQVTFDLSRKEVMPIFSVLTGLKEGDYMQIINPPSFLSGSTIRQLLFGFTENLSAFQYTLQFNAVPESPYEV